MGMLGYKPCYADPDLWMRDAVNKDGVEYYEFVLLYMDNYLTIGQHAEEQLKQIDKYFPMKPSSMGPPKLYLGAKIGKMDMKNGVKAFYFSVSQHVNESVRNVENHLKKRKTQRLSNYLPARKLLKSPYLY